MVERKYVDVNVFVYWLGGHEEFGEKALEWIKRVERSPPGEFVTSSLAIYETIVILAGLIGKNLKDLAFVQSVITDITRLRGLKIAPLTTNDLKKALKLMQTYKLDFEDAIHLAVALREKTIAIISNDTDYDRTPLKRLF